MAESIAGVVACMQLIEMACEELDRKAEDGIFGLDVLPEIQQGVRIFFQTPSLLQGRGFFNKTTQQMSHFKGQHLQSTLFNQKVIVDGIEITFEELLQELGEVLDDVEQMNEMNDDSG